MLADCHIRTVGTKPVTDHFGTHVDRNPGLRLFDSLLDEMTDPFTDTHDNIVDATGPFVDSLFSLLSDKSIKPATCLESQHYAADTDCNPKAEDYNRCEHV